VIGIPEEDTFVEIYEDEYGNEIVEHRDPEIIAVPKNQMYRQANNHQQNKGGKKNQHGNQNHRQ
jgi:hypothetical protein